MTEREAEAKSRLMRAKIEPLAELEAALKRDIGPEPNTTTARPGPVRRAGADAETAGSRGSLREGRRRPAGNGRTASQGGTIQQASCSRLAAAFFPPGWKTGRRRKRAGAGQAGRAGPRRPSAAGQLLPSGLERVPRAALAEASSAPASRNGGNSPAARRHEAPRRRPGHPRRQAGHKKPERTPWLVEKKFGKGTVILCSVPLDELVGHKLPHAAPCRCIPVLVNNLDRLPRRFIRDGIQRRAGSAAGLSAARRRTRRPDEDRGEDAARRWHFAGREGRRRHAQATRSYPASTC